MESEYWNEYNLRAITTVCKNGENSDKFTFIFRKKLYISKKLAVTKFATSASRKTLAVMFPDAEKRN